VAPEILADGRISRLFGSGFLDEELVVPRFVVEELRRWEASGQRGEKQRGKRGGFGPFRRMVRGRL